MHDLNEAFFVNESSDEKKMSVVEILQLVRDLNPENRAELIDRLNWDFCTYCGCDSDCECFDEDEDFDDECNCECCLGICECCSDEDYYDDGYDTGEYVPE